MASLNGSIQQYGTGKKPTGIRCFPGVKFHGTDAGNGAFGRRLIIRQKSMIKINLKQFFFDRVWFGFVAITGRRNRYPFYLLFLGWQLCFIPMRLRLNPPPTWYIKLLRIKYYDSVSY